MKLITCLLTVCALAIAGTVSGGCAATNGGGQGPTSPPAPFFVIDQAAVDRLVEAGLQDYLDLAAAGAIKDQNVIEAAAAAQAAIDAYKNAPPGSPEGNTLFKAAHDAVMKYLIAKAQANGGGVPKPAK